MPVSITMHSFLICSCKRNSIPKGRFYPPLHMAKYFYIKDVITHLPHLTLAISPPSLASLLAIPPVNLRLMVALTSPGLYDRTTTFTLCSGTIPGLGIFLRYGRSWVSALTDRVYKDQLRKRNFSPLWAVVGSTSFSGLWKIS